MYPPKCPICNSLLPEGKLACTKCRDSLPYITEPRCKKCGKKIISDRLELCPDCKQYNHSFEQARAVWVLKGDIQKSIYAFKFANKRDYARFYASEAVRLNGEWIKEIAPDIIIPVPLHSSKRRERGYNQSFLVAREISKLVNIPAGEDILLKIAETQAQKKLSRTERKNNLKNAFKIGNSALQYKRVLVVDDIYTTGSTADAVSDVLYEAGAEAVYVLCMCTGENY